MEQMNGCTYANAPILWSDATSAQVRNRMALCESNQRLRVQINAEALVPNQGQQLQLVHILVGRFATGTA
jgi:hypothetical protein